MKSHPLSRVLVLAAASLLALALAAPLAAAATPIDLGFADSSPRLATTEDGSGYLSWSDHDALKLCKLSPGASGCSEAKTFSDPSVGYSYNEGSAPLAASGRVLLVSGRFKSETQRFLYSSTGSFAAPTQITNSSTAMTDAAFAPAGSVSANERILTVTSGPVTNGGNFQATSTSGSEKAPGYFSLSNGHSTSAETVARVGSTAYAAYIDLEDGNIYMRSYSGDGTLVHLNESSRWTARSLVAAGGDNVVLAGGSSGLYVAYDRPSDETVMLQKFTGSGWTAPIEISTAHTINGWFALFEDANGVLHFCWEDGSHLMYRYGRDASNSSFTYPQDLSGQGDFRDPQLAVNAAGNGWISWQNFSDYHAEAIPIAPGEGTPPPAPAPPGPGTYKGPTKNSEKSLGHGLKASLNTPKSCVAGGQVFKAKVAVKRKGSAAHKASYTVKQVKFFLAGKLRATDKRKPFEISFPTSGVAAGKTLTVAAKIKVNLHIGRRHTTVAKTIKAPVKTCG